MKTVLIDVDDTLADTQSAILREINQDPGQQYAYTDLTREHREKNSGRYYESVQKLLNNPTGLNIAPYSDALAGLKKLHQAGYEIHIASARKENLHQLTLDWLQEHGFIDFVERVHPRSSEVRGHEFKVMVSKDIRPAAAFDDTLEVAEALAGNGTTVFLINKPWNASERLPSNIIRTKDFGSAVNQFLSENPTPPN